MKTIWKYPLDVKINQTIELRVGAKIICCKMQSHQLMLWAEFDTEVERTETRTIMIVGTGHPINATAYKYIESVLDGSYVWHIYEVL